MLKEISIQETIKNLEEGNNALIRYFRFTKEELNKAYALNKAYRTFLNSHDNAEREMFYMMLKVVDIENWKDLCEIQQTKDLLSLLEEANEYEDAKLYREFDDEAYIGKYHIEYDDDKIVFDMNDSFIEEI